MVWVAKRFFKLFPLRHAHDRSGRLSGPSAFARWRSGPGASWSFWRMSRTPAIVVRAQCCWCYFPWAASPSLRGQQSLQTNPPGKQPVHLISGQTAHAKCHHKKQLTEAGQQVPAPNLNGHTIRSGRQGAISAADHFGRPCLCRVRQSCASRRMVRDVGRRRRGRRFRPENPWPRCRLRARRCRCRAAAGWRRRSGRRPSGVEPPDLDVDRRAAAIGDADEAGLGHRLAGQRVEPVGRRRPGRPAEPRAELA